MIDLKFIRTHADQVRQLCARRRASVDVDQLIAHDERVRTLTARVESLRQQRKGGADSRESAIAIREEIAALDTELRGAREARDRLWSWVPNLLADDTPVGEDDTGNVELSRWGTLPSLTFQPKTHEILGERLGVIDETRGAKVAGSGYTFWVGDGARLAWGLFSLALDYLTERGFRQMFTPVVARDRTLFGTGYLPFFSDQIYRVAGEDLSLIGTSAQTLVAYHADEIVPADELPLRYTAFTPCFRTEAGSYGREARGMFRQHQFHKVEQIVLCTPASSEEWLQRCLENAEGMLQLLEVPYRVVRVCDGDLGAPGFKKYDVEAWFAGYGGYRETHSITNLTDFQSRRLNIRCKTSREAFIPHTISATMITDRALLAILENHQRADGSVAIPEALRPFVGGRTDITADR